MRVLLVLTLAACAPAATPQARTIANKPTAPPPVVAATCSEAAVILRGAIDSDDKQAGPSKEVAIATACSKGSWSPAVLSCLASSPQGEPCLAKLTETQHAAYDEAISAWNGTYGEGVGEDDPPPPPDDFVACEDALPATEIYGPIAVKDADDRAFELAMRTKALVAQCNAGWDTEARRCMQGAKDPAAAAVCVGMLEQSQRSELSTKLVELDTLMTKIAAARKKPATIECKKVVTAHYGDAMWKGKLDSQKPADRKAAIEDSRKRMTTACTTEKWTPTVRACVIANGGDDCTADTWHYPAGGVMVPTGIPECDAYGAAIVKLSACSSVPKSTRDAMLDSFTQGMSALSSLPAESRQAMADACKQAAAAVAQMCSH